MPRISHVRLAAMLLKREYLQDLFRTTFEQMSISIRSKGRPMPNMLPWASHEDVYWTTFGAPRSRWSTCMWSRRCHLLNMNINVRWRTSSNSIYAHPQRQMSSFIRPGYILSMYLVVTFPQWEVQDVLGLLFCDWVGWGRERKQQFRPRLSAVLILLYGKESIGNWSVSGFYSKTKEKLNKIPLHHYKILSGKLQAMQFQLHVKF
jgi:hypothetical protein